LHLVKPKSLPESSSTINTSTSGAFAQNKPSGATITFLFALICFELFASWDLASHKYAQQL